MSLSSGGIGLTQLPAQASVVVRWSADDIPAQADNTALASWTDSISGLVMAQPTGTKQPNYRAAQFNGKPGVQFTATNSHALLLARASAGILNTTTATQKFTVFIVHRSTANTASTGMLFSTGNGVAPLAFYNDGTQIGRNGDTLTKVGYTAQTLTTLGYTNTTVAPNVQSTGLARTYVNGTCIGGKQSPGSSGGTGDYGLGAAGDGTFPNNCVIFDVIVFNVELTPVQLLQCEKWARDKYGQAYPWSGVSNFTVFHGDSITENVNASAADYTYPQRAANILGLSFGQWTNLGIGGATVGELDARAVYEVDPIAAMTSKPSKLAYFEFYNSANRGALTGAQIASANQTYLQNRAAAGITKIAFGTCTDTSGNTTNNAVQAKITSYVTSVLALSTSLYSGLVRIDQDTNIGVAGSSASLTYFAADAIHLTGVTGTTNGYYALANLFAPALSAIP